MRPSFRTDLTCSREEEQGVVFYRIDDPTTQASFRLYEIEYLIAQKLDGTRTLNEVIEAVKDEYNFDITDADLQKFISQLQSMGFVGGVDGDTQTSLPSLDSMGGANDGLDVTSSPLGDGVDGEAETAVVPTQKVSAEQIEDLIHHHSGHVDQVEFDRLLKSAFLHVKQGYLVHARDYFLAARELDPSHEALRKLVHHLDAVGDGSGPAEVQYLWNHARTLFPELTDQVGPLLEAQSGAVSEAVAQAVTDSVTRSSDAWDQDLQVRVRLTLALAGIIVGGIALVIFAILFFGIFDSDAQVSVERVAQQSVPIFFVGQAESVAPVHDTWLAFESDGIVSMLPKVKQTLAANEVVARLSLPPKVEGVLKKTRAAVASAQQAHEAAQQRLQAVLDERARILGERNAADAKLKELRPQSVLKKGGVSRRDLEKWKRIRVRANKELSKLARSERKPRAAEASAKRKLAAARGRLEKTLERIGGKVVRVPFAGTVQAVNAEVGAQVKAGQRVVHVTDSHVVQVVFALEDTGSVQTGGEVMLSVGDSKPVAARVAGIEKNGRARIEIGDASGTYVEMEPKSFRLVERVVESAYEIPSVALLRDADGDPFVYIAVDERAVARPVEVLSEQDGRVVVRDAEGTLPDELDIITEVIDSEQGMAALQDGEALQLARGE